MCVAKRRREQAADDFVWISLQNFVHQMLLDCQHFIDFTCIHKMGFICVCLSPAKLNHMIFKSLISWHSCRNWESFYHYLPKKSPAVLMNMPPIIHRLCAEKGKKSTFGCGAASFVLIKSWTICMDNHVKCLCLYLWYSGDKRPFIIIIISHDVCSNFDVKKCKVSRCR